MNQDTRILFYFANYANDLSQLKKEKQQIRSALLSHKVEHYVIDDATTQDFTQHWGVFRDSVEVLHFSGHANAHSLRMDDNKAAIEILSHLLKQAPELKLVFLNGCATKEQVKVLFDIGVAAVIATDRSIADDQAACFASTFYQSLAKGDTLEQAYVLAKAEVSNLHQLDTFNSFGLYRGLTSDFANASNDFPWGLYLLPQKDTIGQWQLNQSFYLPILDTSYDKLLTTDLDLYVQNITERLQENPHDAELHYGLGLACLQLEEWEFSVQLFNNAINYAPKVADYYYYLCVATIAQTSLVDESPDQIQYLEGLIHEAIQLDRHQAKYFYLWIIIQKQYYLENDLLIHAPDIDELFSFAMTLSYDFWEVRRLQHILELDDTELLRQMHQHAQQ